MRGAAHTTDASSLLRIDFDAAIAKLVWSQLQGPWQLPAELARLAIAAGARALELEIGPRRLALTAPGARLQHAQIAGFATLLDPGLEAARRHRAMVDLETLDAFALAAAACLDVKTSTLVTGGEEGWTVELRDGQLHVARNSAAPPEEERLALVFDGVTLGAERACKWLRRVGRFAPIPIVVNGAAVGRGFAEPLISARLGAAGDGRTVPGQTGVLHPGAPPRDIPLPTHLAIPRHGSSPRLWLLRHGIIATRATVPGYPAFEAAVDMAPVAAPGTSDAVLRERLGPYLEALVDAAVCLTLRLAERAPSLPEAVRARTARLLLEAAHKRRRLSQVSGVKIFPLVSSPTGRGVERRLVSIDEIVRCARIEPGGGCALDAIPAGDDVAAYALAGRQALVVSEAERARLSELLRMAFNPPPARRRRRPGRRLAELAATAWAALCAAAGGEVATAALSPAERTFLERLRPALAADGGTSEVAFRRGRGPVYRTAAGRLLLPRSHPAVRACVAAVDRDPAWLYPALLYLLAGRDLPAPDLRRRWLAAG